MPEQSKQHMLPKTNYIDDLIKSEVRNVINDLRAKRVQITLNSLREELARRHTLEASETTIKRLLINLGFKYLKDNNRIALMERNDIALMRIDFLKKYLQNSLSNNPREQVFLGATCILSKEIQTGSKQASSKKTVRKPESDDRKRFIALHAGNERGFVNNCALIFPINSKVNDYQGDMNNEILIKWLEEQLIPNLQKPSLIVLENAPYHSVLLENEPTTSWTKEKIKEWLEANNIPFNNDMFKIELLQLVKQNKKPARYVVDELLQKHGHEVVRLPPYHCQFNAMEMVWTEAKIYYNKHIGKDGYGDDKVFAMWEQALKTVTPQSWEGKVIYTEKVIREWYNKEVTLDNDNDDVIIHIGDYREEEDNDAL